jgi:hypothetical protein
MRDEILVRRDEILVRRDDLAWVAWVAKKHGLKRASSHEHKTTSKISI